LSGRDPYEVLGIAANATDDQLKRAYRSRARDLHPDRHGQASEQEQEAAQLAMAELNVAYETIRKRRSGEEDRSGAVGDPLEVAHMLASRFAINAAVLRFSPADDDPGKLSRWEQRLLGELLDQLEEQFERSPDDRFADKPSDPGRNAFELFGGVIEDFAWRATNTAKYEGQDVEDAFGLLHVTAFTLYGLAYKIGPGDPGFEQIVDRLANDIIAAYDTRLRTEKARVKRESPRQAGRQDGWASSHKSGEKPPVVWAPFWVAVVALMFFGAAWDLIDGLVGNRPVEGFSLVGAFGLGWLLWWQGRESHRAGMWAYSIHRWLVEANKAVAARRADPPLYDASPPPPQRERATSSSPPHAEASPPPRTATTGSDRNPDRGPEHSDNRVWTAAHEPARSKNSTARSVESDKADTGNRLMLGSIVIAAVVGLAVIGVMSDSAPPTTASGATSSTPESPKPPPAPRPEPRPPQPVPWAARGDCLAESQRERDTWEVTPCGNHDGIIVETQARRGGSVHSCRADHDLEFADEWGFYCGHIVTDSTSAGGSFGMGPVVPGVTCIVVERDAATKRPCIMRDAVTVTHLAASEVACSNETYPSGYYYSLPSSTGQGAVCVDSFEFERVYR
jgi:hypothetical protein